MERTNDDLCTPEWVLDLVRQINPIALDPCYNLWAKTNPTESFDREANGLERNWMPSGGGLVYVNPPYSKPHPWIQRCVEVSAGGYEVMLLVKHDPSTNWFNMAREWCSAECDFRKRIKFDGGEYACGMFASTMFYFGPSPYLFAHVFAPHGHIQIFSRSL